MKEELFPEPCYSIWTLFNKLQEERIVQRSITWVIFCYFKRKLSAFGMCLSSKDGHILFYGEEKGTGLKKGKKNYS